MTDDTQPEAMDLADWLEAVGGGGLSPNRCAALLREQHARIAELESELEAVGAGGVSGPLVGRTSISANAGEPVAIRPDIQAVLAMLDVPVIARMSSHEGKLLKPGQEPPAFESAVPLVREWDHRRACETIIAALSGRMTKENK